MAHDHRSHWTAFLPLMLLGIRAAYKPDLSCSSVQLVYGCTPLRLPAEFLTPQERELQPSALLDRLWHAFDNSAQFPRVQTLQLSPTFRRSYPPPPTFSSVPTPSRNLFPPYPVLEKSDKIFRIAINGRHDTVTVDRLKPAFLENPNLVASSLTGPSPVYAASTSSTKRVVSSGGGVPCSDTQQKMKLMRHQQHIAKPEL
ncbi:uncharacterized protein LOC135400518 [Ornithodoros turicata]|uniref:uncharacterized protein LOC135400518 n=1 Tax=Ornithodoros turicata TaxID=34597 RepID=UPI003138E094